MKGMKRFVSMVSVFMVVLVGFTTMGMGQLKPLYGYYNMFYGARSMGMANAFTAMADDLSAVFRNPAGLAEFAMPQVYIDYRRDKMAYQYEPQSQDYGTYAETYDEVFQSSLKNIDFAAISVPVMFWDMRWCFALSYSRAVPYGISGVSESRFMTDSDPTANRLSTLAMTGSAGLDVLALTGAFYLSDYLSFGITAQRYFNSGTRGFDFTAGTSGYTREYTDKFKDISLILGLRFKLMEEIILGMSYQFACSGPLTSQNTHQVKNNPAAFITQSAATLTIPAQYSAGLLIKPFEFMDLVFDYSRQYWGKAALTNYYGATTPLQFPVANDFSFTQNDTINLRMGTQINIPFKKVAVFIRGGLFSDGQLFKDMDGARVKFKGYSLGLGLEIKPWVQVDAAYMRQKGIWKETGYFDTTPAVNTTAINKIFCVSLTFKFGAPPVFKAPVEED